jgi:hypothetical protein
MLMKEHPSQFLLYFSIFASFKQPSENVPTEEENYAHQKTPSGIIVVMQIVQKSENRYPKVITCYSK